MFVGSSTLDLGDVTSGEPTSLAIPIRNASSSAVKIIGVTTTCSCLQPVGLPATVSPAATHKLAFELMPGRPNPPFRTSGDGYHRRSRPIQGTFPRRGSRDDLAGPLLEDCHGDA
ncbi:MAG: DUF1573 domain-containing protein [Planctomycetaceae bacterium]|nr:DUF1573 domain-containing protein [Planctomycetaceae bacterium]